MLAVASMCLGLFVSAMVSTSEKAMPFLVLFTMVQVVLSGYVVPLAHNVGLKQLAVIAPSRWGLAAAASTVDLNHITAPATVTTRCGRRHRRTGFVTWASWSGSGSIFALLAYLKLRTLGPRRRK